MNCTEFERRLRELVEDRAPVDARDLREHAACCTTCRPQWEENAFLEQAIPLWRRSPLDVDIVDAVLARLRAEQAGVDGNLTGTQNAQSHVTVRGPSDGSQATRGTPPLTRSAPSQEWATVALMATVLLATGVMIARFGSEHSRTDPAHVVDTNLGHTGQSGHEDVPRLDTLVRDASSASLGLAQEAAEAVTDLAMLVPRIDTFPAAREPDMRIHGLGEGWGSNLKPIRDDVGKAIRFLFYAVPVEAAPAT